eukprot:scaffold1141_cov333-Pavlova_lutheri.AAC.45
MDVPVVCSDQNLPLHSVFVFGPLLALGILERQVSNLRVVAHVQHLLDLPSDAELSRFVAGGLRPDGDAILPVPHTEHGTADLVGFVELLSDQRKHCVQPPGVQDGFAPVALGHIDGGSPSHVPTCLVGRCCCTHCQARSNGSRSVSLRPPSLRSYVVDVAFLFFSFRWNGPFAHAPPELFHGCKRDHLSHGASPVGWVLFPRRQVEPERPPVHTQGRFPSVSSHLLLVFIFLSLFASGLLRACFVSSVLRPERPKRARIRFLSLPFHPRVRSRSHLLGHRHPSHSFVRCVLGTSRPLVGSTFGPLPVHAPVFERMFGERLFAVLLSFHFVGHGGVAHPRRLVGFCEGTPRAIPGMEPGGIGTHTPPIVPTEEGK